MNIKNYLKPIYGVDTTLFIKNIIVHLFGGQLKYNSGNPSFLVKQEIIQGIHIIRNHPNDNMLAYHYVFESYYHD